MANCKSGKRMIEELTAGGDVEDILKRYETPHQMLHSNSGRAAVRTRKLLGRIQTELLAARFAPHAMSRLIKLMGEEKPDISLKAALAVLQTGLQKTNSKKTDPAADEETPPPADAPETERLMNAMVQVLRADPSPAEK